MSPTSSATWLKPTARALLDSGIGILPDRFPFDVVRITPACNQLQLDRCAKQPYIAAHGPIRDPIPTKYALTLFRLTGPPHLPNAQRPSPPHNFPCSPIGRGAALRTRRLLVRIQRGAPDSAKDPWKRKPHWRGGRSRKPCVPQGLAGSTPAFPPAQDGWPRVRHRRANPARPKGCPGSIPTVRQMLLILLAIFIDLGFSPS